MRLIIGGCHQGKTEYARRTYPQEMAFLFAEFHKWFRERIESGEDAEAQVEAYLAEHPQAIIVCDEVGNGIVPMEPMEREYRERLGRTLVRIAAEAESVDRVMCGIGQRIKP